MGRLKVKRPKNRLKQKILELGLVDNLKALRKKKASKSNQGKCLLNYYLSNLVRSCLIIVKMNS